MSICKKDYKNNIGEKYYNNQRLGFVITKYINSNNISILFDNGETLTNLSTSRISVGNILPPSQKTIKNKYGNERHGDRYTKLWKEWNTMLWRCNPKNKRHHVWYSDKGILVCDDWQRYLKFKEWALNNGFKENLTIDRIDHNKNYCPENCRWITQEENLADTSLVPVKQFSKDGEFIKEYPTLASASRENQLSVHIIKRICQGNIKDYDEYRWEYANK